MKKKYSFLTIVIVTACFWPLGVWMFITNKEVEK